MKAKAGAGAEFKAELYRNGILVPEERVVKIKIPHGTITVKLIPKEKRNG